MRFPRLSQLRHLLLIAPLVLASRAGALQPTPAQDLASARHGLASARAIEKAVPTKARARGVDSALRAYREAAATRVAQLTAELKALPVGAESRSRARAIAREMRSLGVAPSPSYGSTPVYVPETEPNDAPAAANFLDTFNSTVVIAQGTQAVLGDHDYYRFTAPAGSRLWAYVTNPADGGGKGGGDTQLYLYEADGTTLIEYDDDDGTGNNLDSSIETTLVPSIASASLPTGGTYYLDVAYFEDSGNVSEYLLFVVVETGPGVGEVEPNNAADEAMILLSTHDSWTNPPVGRLGVVNGVCDTSQEDIDYYRVYLQPGNILYVSLDGDPERDLSSNDFTVEILDTSENVLLLMDSSGTTSFGNTPVSEAGALGGFYSELLIRVTPFGFGGGKRAGLASRPNGEGGGSEDTYRLLVAVANDMPLCVSQTSSWVSNLGSFSSSFGVPGYFNSLNIDKLIRDGAPSSCLAPKACPGLDEPYQSQSQLYPLRNNSDQPQCVTVTVQLTSALSCVSPGEQIFVAAYGEEYDPLLGDVCASYLADLGSSPVDTTPRSFSVVIPPRSWAWLVFYDEASQLSCPQDVLFSVSGLPPGCVADMSITKTGPVVSEVGPGPISYDITVENNGPMTPPAWEFEDTVPAGYQLTGISSTNQSVQCIVGFSPPAFPVAAGTLVRCFLFGPIPLGALTTVTFQFDSSGVADGACVTNTATLVEPQPPNLDHPAGNGAGQNEFAYTDPNPSNDTSSAATCFGNPNNLTLWKLDGDGKNGGPDPVAAGRDLTYTLRIVNPGPGDAFQVLVVDDLRAVTRINPPHEGTTVPLRFKAIREPGVGDWTCTTPYPGVIGVVECRSAVLPPGIHDIGLVVTVPPVCSPPGDVAIRNWAVLTAFTDTDPNDNVAFQDTLVLADPCFGVGGPN